MDPHLGFSNSVQLGANFYPFFFGEGSPKIDYRRETKGKAGSFF